MDLEAWLADAAAQAPEPVLFRERALVADREPGDRWAWMDDAACRGMDPELFFPFEKEPIDPRAKAACERCEVRARCLEYALAHERLGWWAGTSEKARKRMRRSLGIQLAEPAPEPDPPPPADPPPHGAHP